eukprot:gene18050-21498_t
MMLTADQLNAAALGSSDRIEDAFKLRSHIKAENVVIFMESYCPFCNRVVNAFIAANISHKRVLLDPAMRATLTRLTGQRTIPYVYVRGQFIGGCNDGPEDWMGALKLLQSGALHKMLSTSPLSTQQGYVEEKKQGIQELQIYDVVIIGSGMAGLTAALYLARAHRNPVVLAGNGYGQLMKTDMVHNFPGFPEGIPGPELMRNLRRQAETAGARILMDSVREVQLHLHPFKIKLVQNTLLARSVIVATGSSPRWLDLPHEKSLQGKYIHTCVHCDAALYKGLEVLVVGGGDSAMEAAVYLSRIGAKRVYVVHRRAQFRAAAVLVSQAKQRENIVFK